MHRISQPVYTNGHSEMELGSESDGFGSLGAAFERSLPEDAAEYMIFVLDDGQGKTETSAARPRARLDQVRKAALQLSDTLTKDYIWQREAFGLDVVSRNGLLYLHGLTSYGDCVEDEWLIVYILRELSRSYPDVWIRVCDSDGEFLLVEAASVVPKWLNPEVDANRVWINKGQLKIIPVRSTEGAVSEHTAIPQRPSIVLAEAVHAIKAAPDSLLHIPALEQEAFYRLGKYPDYVTTSMHHARLVLPRKIAYILHDRPRAVAPAVEAFLMRNPITAKQQSLGTLQFPPSDLVVVSVRFTRVLYAQLRGQRFTPPSSWPAIFASFAKANFSLGRDSTSAGEQGRTTSADRLVAMVEMSMKLTFGFELMASTADTSNNRIVREVGLILEDLAEDGDNAATLPSDKAIQAWKDYDREDDDSWLDIDFADFERELDSRRQGENGESSGPRQSQPDPGSGFGDRGVQTDLRRIVSQFQAFLNDDDAGIEGAEVDEMDRDDDDDSGDDSEDDEDSDVDFDEEEFSRLMREMMGLPPAAPALPADKGKTAAASAPSAATGTEKAGTVDTRATAEAGDAATDEEESILKLAAEFEAELKGHGALKLNPPRPGKPGSSSLTAKRSAAAKDDGGRAGGVAGDATLGGNAEIGRGDGDDDDGDDDDDDGEVDVDFNLAKNLLESFKGQQGMAGPAGNILSMLGLTLPRDDDEDDDGDDDG